MAKNPKQKQQKQYCNKFHKDFTKCSYIKVLLPGKSHGQGGLVGYIQSMGSQRVRHHGLDLAAAAYIKKEVSEDPNSV